MCGIFGIVRQDNKPVATEVLQQAIELVKHRGPNGQDFYIQTNWGFAHARLAILDLSPKGRQPMHFKGLVITFNGEIYNYLEIRKTLQGKGYSFSTQTDTEVLLAAYDFWGEDCVQHFNGMWAFAIYDPSNKKIFCSRDRFGIKPFYYTLVDQQFCFASEIKQFTSLPSWSPTLNKTIAYEFLIKGYHDHSRDTFFQGVYQLRGGQNLIYNLDQHRFQVKTYYQVKDKISRKEKIDTQEAIDAFQKNLSQSIDLRLRSDVPIGTALSGGLDSSSIVCGMQQLLNQKSSSTIQESISCCFPNTPYDESKYVDAIIAKTGIRNHKVFPSWQDTLRSWDQVIWNQDEPIATASVIAQAEVFRTAKQKGLTVMLDGQGADEILGGYEKFYAPWLKNIAKKNPLKAATNLLSFFYLHHIGPLDALRQVRHFATKDQPNTMDWLDKNWIPEQQYLFSRSIDDTLTNTSVNLLNEMGMQILLHYADRNSMAASVESRLPFLDYQLVEFCLGLPDHLKINKARRKYILREAMKPYLPDSIYHRYDKLGFATPQENWIEQHPNLILKLVKEAQISFPEIFNTNWMMWAGTVLSKKQRSHYPLLWRAISLGKWGRLYLGRK